MECLMNYTFAWCLISISQSNDMAVIPYFAHFLWSIWPMEWDFRPGKKIIILCVNEALETCPGCTFHMSWHFFSSGSNRNCVKTTTRVTVSVVASYKFTGVGNVACYLFGAVMPMSDCVYTWLGPSAGTVLTTSRHEFYFFCKVSFVLMISKSLQSFTLTKQHYSHIFVMSQYQNYHHHYGTITINIMIIIIIVHIMITIIITITAH